jgi:hypothetical protein
MTTNSTLPFFNTAFRPAVCPTNQVTITDINKDQYAGLRSYYIPIINDHNQEEESYYVTLGKASLEEERNTSRADLVPNQWPNTLQ